MLYCCFFRYIASDFSKSAAFLRSRERTLELWEAFPNLNYVAIRQSAFHSLPLCAEQWTIAFTRIKICGIEFDWVIDNFAKKRHRYALGLGPSFVCCSHCEVLLLCLKSEFEVKCWMEKLLFQLKKSALGSFVLQTVRIPDQHNRSSFFTNIIGFPN